MFSVHRPWDPLDVCVVGKSYSPEFYKFIKNSKLRGLFEQIAQETEEDYQFLIKTLEKFNVTTVRPNVPEFQIDEYLTKDKRIPGPVSMTPRDQMIMIGNRFFFYPFDNISAKASGRLTNVNKIWNEQAYNDIKGPDYPKFTEYSLLPQWIQDECKGLLSLGKTTAEMEELTSKTAAFEWWSPVIDLVNQAGNEIVDNFKNTQLSNISSNGITRIDTDLFFGCGSQLSHVEESEISETFFQDYNCQFIYTGGHIDGCFSPTVPGLIMSIKDMDTYSATFPDWEVVYLEGQSWDKVQPFLDLKAKNAGNWWIKGYEHDDTLIEFVETWLRDWVGYAEESVFDVNILTIDEKNVIVNGYNKQAFDAFERYGVTPHICPVRHRYFWDGGVHCNTLDLNRLSV